MDLDGVEGRLGHHCSFERVCEDAQTNGRGETFVGAGGVAEPLHEDSTRVGSSAATRELHLRIVTNTSNPTSQRPSPWCGLSPR